MRKKELVYHSDKVFECTAKACGVGVWTVYRIENVFKTHDVLCTPQRRYSKSRVQILLDDFNVEASIVHEFNTKKEYPTMDSLLSVLKSRVNCLHWWTHNIVASLDFGTGSMRTSTTSMNSQGSYNKGMTTSLQATAETFVAVTTRDGYVGVVLCYHCHLVCVYTL